MKQKEFMQETSDWLDRFITVYDRSPKSYVEYIQFVMDTLVDEGKV